MRQVERCFKSKSAEKEINKTHLHNGIVTMPHYVRSVMLVTTRNEQLVWRAITSTTSLRRPVTVSLWH